MTNTKNKCSFCRYWSGSSCMVTPNSFYCKEANNEYYQYLNNKKSAPVQKSLRSWDIK
jgi:hypothetical protein